jgi:hypothetical protein
VWDDAPAAPAAAATLINDLDLELENPNGTTFRPWTLNAANPGNNAGNGVDRTNNVEQVTVNNPLAGLWMIRVNGFGINEPAPNPLQRYSLVSDFPYRLGGDVSVVQVIDRTGSMGFYGYMEPAKTAAKNFVGLMRLGDEAGVVAFDDQGCDDVGSKSESVFNLTQLTTETIRDNVVNSITPLSARGCTSIGGGLQRAQEGPNFLNTASGDNPHAMVLLTDGFENTTPWVRGRPPDYSHKPATPNNILTSIPEKTKIYTIALGSTADTDLMKDVANTTGGKFYESPTILGLLSIYYQIQGDVELGDMADLATGTKGGGNETRIVPVDPNTSEVTFVVGWLQSKARLQLAIEDPAGTPVDENYARVEASGQSTYHYLRISDPPPGDWEVRIVRADRGSFLVDYTFAAFVKDVPLLTSLVADRSLAGDCLMAKLRLADPLTSQPILGATVTAAVSSPQKSRYALHYALVDPGSGDWQPVRHMSAVSSPTAGDSMPAWANVLRVKDRETLQATGRSVFQFERAAMTLFDDGTHGDEVAQDGIYTACFTATQNEGHYSFNINVSGITPGGSRFQRRLVHTATVEHGAVDPAKTLVRVDPPVIDPSAGVPSIVTVVPMDRFGNPLGPGYSSQIAVATTGGRLPGEPQDNGDGFYFYRIPADRISAPERITVIIDGREMQTRPVLRVEDDFPSFGISGHVGRAFPLSDLSNAYDPDMSYGADIHYAFDCHWAVFAIWGYNQFKSKIAGIDDLQIQNFSLDVRYYPLCATVTPYVAVGPGAYLPKNGDTQFGGNAALGLKFQITSNLALDAGANYHYMFDSGNTQFLVGQVGILLNF